MHSGYVGGVMEVGVLTVQGPCGIVNMMQEIKQHGWIHILLVSSMVWSWFAASCHMMEVGGLTVQPPY
jgi:hypothetical protein